MVSAYAQTVAELKEELLKEVGGKIASIILYGSVARSGAHEESDLDILIITAEEDEEAYERSSRIRTSTKPRKPGLDISPRPKPQGVPGLPQRRLLVHQES